MTNAAHKLELIRDKLLDIKRNLEKSQREVDHGENDPETVSAWLTLALQDVYASLTLAA